MVGTSNQNRPCKWMNGLICVMVGEGVHIMPWVSLSNARYSQTLVLNSQWQSMFTYTLCYHLDWHVLYNHHDLSFVSTLITRCLCTLSNSLITYSSVSSTSIGISVVSFRKSVSLFVNTDEASSVYIWELFISLHLV